MNKRTAAAGQALRRILGTNLAACTAIQDAPEPIQPRDADDHSIGRVERPHRQLEVLLLRGTGAALAGVFHVIRHTLLGADQSVTRG
jgi:hypothetical protein